MTKHRDVGRSWRTHAKHELMRTPPFEWVARIALQAKEAGCKVHLKPNLLRVPGMRLLDEYPDVGGAA